MAKNLFETVHDLLIPFMLFAMTAGFTLKNGNFKIRQNFIRITAGAFVFIFAVSLLRQQRLIKYNQINNIYLLVTSLISGLAYCVLNWITYLKQNSSRITDIVKWSLGGLFVFTLLLCRIPPIYELPFHFVVMDDTYFSTQFLLKCTGYLCGWLCCILTCFALYIISNRISEKQSLLCFSGLYLIGGFISFVSVLGIINSYYRRRFKIPAGLRTKLPQLIEAENLIFFAALICVMILSLAFFIYNVKIHGEYTNPAEHRRLRAAARNNRRWAGFLIALAVFCWIDMTAIKKIANKVVVLSPSEEYTLENGEIFIPIEQVLDGHLHRFTWVNDRGKEIRFIIVQKRGTNLGVGFDACEVCGDAGYYERKNEIVCSRCDVVMNKSTIGLKGGCNPIPLASRIEDGQVIIRTSDVNKEEKRFR